MHYYYDYGTGSNDTFSIIYTLLVLALVFLGALVTIHYLRKDFGGGKHSEDDALSILKTRYARGEIDKKEFEQKKKDLNKK